MGSSQGTDTSPLRFESHIGSSGLSLRHQDASVSPKGLNLGHRREIGIEHLHLAGKLKQKTSSGHVGALTSMDASMMVVPSVPRCSSNGISILHAWKIASRQHYVSAVFEACDIYPGMAQASSRSLGMNGTDLRSLGGDISAKEIPHPTGTLNLPTSG